MVMDGHQIRQIGHQSVWLLILHVVSWARKIIGFPVLVRTKRRGSESRETGSAVPSRAVCRRSKKKGSVNYIIIDIFTRLEPSVFALDLPHII